MASTTTGDFEKMLKVWYDSGRVKLRAYEKNPALALIPKDESMRGRNRTVPMWYRVGQGVSATFERAQTRVAPGGYENWVLTRVKGYGLGRLENEVVEASKGDKAAFMEATAEIDGVFHQVTRDLAIAMYRERHGQRGAIATGGIANGDGTNDKITLATRADITNFEVGMWLYASSDATSANLRGSPTAYVVSRIDRQAGDLYMGTAIGTPVNVVTGASWAAGDTLHREGDITSASETLKLSGFAEWIPSTAPTSGDSHFGVDRSTDVERLAGVRVDGSSMSIEDALIEGAAALHEVGAMPDIVFMGPMQFKRLVRELGSKVEHDIVKSPDLAKIGFKSVKLYTAAGVLDVVPDHNCQYDTAWMLTKSTWTLYSMGGAPRMLTYGPGDGNRWLRVSDEDAVEYRTGWYGQLGCKAPGHNARITLPS